MLIVIRVVLEFYKGVSEGVGVAEFHLSPAGEAGLNGVAEVVEGGFAFQLSHELRPLRPRTHEAHLPSQNVNQLWELIESSQAEESPYPCDPLVPSLCPSCFPLSARGHGAQLDDLEDLASLSHPLLAVKRRARAIDDDGQAEDEK